MSGHSAERDALTQEEREALDRASSVFGWQHLARYSGMSTDWLNLTLIAIVRSALAAHTCVTPPAVPCEHDTLGCGWREPHDAHTKTGDGRPCCGWPPQCHATPADEGRA